MPGGILHIPGIFSQKFMRVKENLNRLIGMGLREPAADVTQKKTRAIWPASSSKHRFAHLQLMMLKYRTTHG
jgi:hypothetical protein